MMTLKEELEVAVVRARYDRTYSLEELEPLLGRIWLRLTSTAFDEETILLLHEHLSSTDELRDFLPTTLYQRLVDSAARIDGRRFIENTKS